MKAIPVSLMFAGVLAVFASGCAAQPESETAEAEQAAGVPVSTIVPGQFRLFSKPNHQPSPLCESYTDLTLTAAGQAKLINGLSGTCPFATLLDLDPRDYWIRETGNECGSKIYAGGRIVNIGHPATVATIKITDHRTRLCDDGALATIIVEETTPGFPGPITTTKYSSAYPINPPRENAVISCRQNVDHGPTVEFFGGGAGKIAHAVYAETTFVDTQVISDMTVCTSHPTGPNADQVDLTVSCNDGSRFDSYAVELYEGGFSGIPSAKLYQTIATHGPTRLVHSFVCHYVLP